MAWEKPKLFRLPLENVVSKACRGGLTVNGACLDGGVPNRGSKCHSGMIYNG